MIGIGFLGMIVFWAIGLFILYFVITIAVRDGINKSVIGRTHAPQHQPTENKKSWLDDDLDN